MTTTINAMEAVKNAKETIITMSNGVKIFNTTPLSGVIINGKPIEKEVGLLEHMNHAGFQGKITLVETHFVGDEKSMEYIRAMDELLEDDVLYIGSLAAAQAYPGTILAMIPQPGFERVPPNEKRMRVDKFTTF